jgi:hypothetical protein
MDNPVALDLLAVLMRQMIGSQRRLRQRVGRAEQGLLAMQRALVDRVEADAAMQEKIGTLARRLERLEDRLAGGASVRGTTKTDDSLVADIVSSRR